MERSDLKKVMAGFGLAALLAGVVVAGCSNAQKSSWTGNKSGAGGTENKQQSPAPGSWGGTKGAGGAGGSWGGTKK